MSSNPERIPEDGEGTMIPVFTVIKNGVILKNIFVVNEPPSQRLGISSINFVENSENSDQETEEILIAGRHPDCNIVLMHPSISRFHLQINLNPSRRKLFVTDLSSVHGTWISEKKIDPGFRTELREGDTIRVGGSTRVYRLHWVRWSRAYDSENPFVSESDLALIEEKEEENVEKMSQNEDLFATENKIFEEKDSLAVLGKVEDTNQVVDSLDSEKGETQSVDSILEDVVSLLPDENSGLIMKTEIPPSTSVEINSSHGGKEEIENSSRNYHELSLKSVGGVILQTLSAIFNDCNKSPEYHSAEEDTDISMMTRLELESHVEVSSDSPSSIKGLDSASKITKEGILREATIDVPAAIEVLEETEDQSPLMKEGILGEATIDDPAAIEALGEIEDQSPLRKERILREATIDAPAAIEALEETEDQSPLMKEGILGEATIDDPAAIEALGEIEDQSPLRKERILREPISDDPAAIEVLQQIEYQSLLRKERILNEAIDDPAAIEVFGETENQSPSTKEGVLRKTVVSSVHLETEESPNSSMPRAEVLPGSKQSQTPQSNFPEIENLENIIASCDGPEKRLGSCNIWSRRGKPASAPQLQKSRSQIKTKRDKETDGSAKWENGEDSGCSSPLSDLTPNASIPRFFKKNVERNSTARALFSDGEGLDKENFTPNKENCTPKSAILRSKKKPNIVLEDNMITSSDKENQTPQILQEMKSAGPSRHHFKLNKDIVLKERRPERVPLQTLISNSPVMLPVAAFRSAAKRSRSSISCNQKKVTISDSINSVGDRRRWTMIADTASLLNKETRNALQLLQGLKGTHLIIPRIVIRELDSLKRDNSLFRRETEASVVLQWIEECMVKTKWWIHVQNSVEEVRPTAPTPPAAPVSQFGEGSECFPFSAHGTPMGLVSPTAEDHILECALLYRKMNNDRQLVLLSNDVTVKIKAMAEGLICETAQEFRDSLVNPFSKRFLWTDSSPRGQTWSVFDDVVLKEMYYRSTSKKSSRREAAKGLKLILLHNSHYVKTV
ncbi:FHA domain-containing protein PS1-like [Euphorbia lathyris]|uniref:FHA domain-containing protein PS1-like n=1 Tax=Euphorbia lathyris TaxID=212925 RepID=UPI003313FFE7